MPDYLEALNTGDFDGDSLYCSQKIDLAMVQKIYSDIKEEMDKDEQFQYISQNK